MMKFSSLKLFAKDMYHLLGQPNYLRWLQWPALSSMLNICEGAVILDLGSGNMQYAIHLSKNIRVKVVAVDYELLIFYSGISSEHDISVVCADGQSLPFAKHSIDRILMSSLFHMVPEPGKLLEECRRVLKPDGIMVLSVPNHYQFIPKILGCPFGVKLCRYLGIPVSIEGITELLNASFKVHGPRGYYLEEELHELLRKGGFEIVQHKYAPGMIGSFFWECAVLAYIRMGNFAFHLLFLLYPIARACDLLEWQSGHGSEHIVKAISR